MKRSIAAFVALAVCVVSTSAHFYTPQRWGHMMHYNPQFMHRPMHFSMHKPMHYSMHQPMQYPMHQPMQHPMHQSMPVHEAESQQPGQGGEPQRLADTTLARAMESAAFLMMGSPIYTTLGLIRAADLARGV